MEPPHCNNVAFIEHAFFGHSACSALFPPDEPEPWFNPAIKIITVRCRINLIQDFVEGTKDSGRDIQINIFLVRLKFRLFERGIDLINQNIQ